MGASVVVYAADRSGHAHVRAHVHFHIHGRRGGVCSRGSGRAHVHVHAHIQGSGRACVHLRVHVHFHAHIHGHGGGGYVGTVRDRVDVSRGGGGIFPHVRHDGGIVDRVSRVATVATADLLEARLCVDLQAGEGGEWQRWV